MELDLLFKLVLLKGLLITTALTDCYPSGNAWSEIGDDNIITDAFKDLCSHMAGNYQIGSSVGGCTNVQNHRIDARIVIFDTENHTFTSDATLYEDVCEKLLSQVKSDCPEKGGVMNESAHAGSEFHQYGYIFGEIKADPNRNGC